MWPRPVNWDHLPKPTRCPPPSPKSTPGLEADLDGQVTCPSPLPPHPWGLSQGLCITGWDHRVPSCLELLPKSSVGACTGRFHLPTPISHSARLSGPLRWDWAGVEVVRMKSWRDFQKPGRGNPETVVVGGWWQECYTFWIPVHSSIRYCTSCPELGKVGQLVGEGLPSKTLFCWPREFWEF